MSKHKIRVGVMTTPDMEQSEKAIDEMAYALGNSILSLVTVAVEKLQDGSTMRHVSISFEDLDDSRNFKSFSRMQNRD